MHPQAHICNLSQKIFSFCFRWNCGTWEWKTCTTVMAIPIVTQCLHLRTCTGNSFWNRHLKEDAGTEIHTHCPSRSKDASFTPGGVWAQGTSSASTSVQREGVLLGSLVSQLDSCLGHQQFKKTSWFLKVSLKIDTKSLLWPDNWNGIWSRTIVTKSGWDQDHHWSKHFHPTM